MDGGRISVGSEVGVGVVAHISRNTLHCLFFSWNPGTSQVVPWDFPSRFSLVTSTLLFHSAFLEWAGLWVCLPCLEQVSRIGLSVCMTFQPLHMAELPVEGLRFLPFLILCGLDGHESSKFMLIWSRHYYPSGVGVTTIVLVWVWLLVWV